jgi:hypothetical protein
LSQEHALATGVVVPARANPFRMERIEALPYRLDEAGWRDLLARFAAQRWRGLLLGPNGSGKTTLCEAMARRLAADGWLVRTLVLSDHQPVTWPRLIDASADGDGRTVLTIDGLDRVPWWWWWRWRPALRRLGGVLATSHQAGRLPVLRHHHTTPALLHDLVCELIGGDRPGLGERCTTLFHRHRGDLRACLRVCYDEAARGTFSAGSV